MAYYAQRLKYIEDLEENSCFALVALHARKSGKPVRFIVYRYYCGIIEVQYFGRREEEKARNAYPFGRGIKHDDIPFYRNAGWFEDIVWQPHKPGIVGDFVKVRPPVNFR